jgi:2'-5' RNA ligase
MLLVEDQQARAMRVFVGLKIDPDVADLLVERARLIESPPSRFVARDDIHLTLLPPWDETCIGKAIKNLRAALSGMKTFTLVFTQLSYWPDRHHPHLLCAECLPSDELRSLQQALLSAFGQTEDKPFRPHVTLARIQRRAKAAGRRSGLDEELRLVQAIESVELFQSGKDADKGYQVLASLPLAVTSRKWSDLLRQGVIRIAELWDQFGKSRSKASGSQKARSQRDTVSKSGVSKCCNS